MKSKERLDLLMVERGLAPTREKARGMIMAGEVTVDGILVDKPGSRFTDQVMIAVRSRQRFVSRGGDKLLHALQTFDVDPAGRVCADVGASTGGFTDCLLQHGAGRVYALDVGYGQLDFSLRQNPRVIAIERTNARYVERLAEPISLAVIDASFISLKLLLPVICGWLTPEADVIPLIKPQFEAGKAEVGKGGVVKDPQVHRRVLSEILAAAVERGFTVRGLVRSPILGPAGNVEFLAWLKWGQAFPSSVSIPSLVTAVVS